MSALYLFNTKNNDVLIIDSHNIGMGFYERLPDGQLVLKSPWRIATDEEIASFKLQEAKKTKIEELKTKLAEACGSFFYEGHPFCLNEDSIQNLVLKDSCPPSIESRYKFFDKNRELVDFGNEEGFSAFKEFLFVRKNWVMVKYNQWYGEIMACQTISAVEAIVIDFSP